MFCLSVLIILYEIRLNTYYDLNELKNCIINYKILHNNPVQILAKSRMCLQSFQVEKL